jgi:hypothetical protein
MKRTMTLVAAALVGATALTAIGTDAEARNGRKGAFAAGAALGVLGGAAIAGSAYGGGYGYGNGYGSGGGYGYGAGYGNGYGPGYGYVEPGYADGCYDDPECGAVAPVYRVPPRRVYVERRYEVDPGYGYDGGYRYSNRDLAWERFYNKH